MRERAQEKKKRKMGGVTAAKSKWYNREIVNMMSRVDESLCVSRRGRPSHMRTLTRCLFAVDPLVVRRGSGGSRGAGRGTKIVRWSRRRRTVARVESSS
jgi:hypothetical protein